jgi:hypothetical protein
MRIPAFYIVAVALLVVTACIVEPRSGYNHGEQDHGDRDRDRENHAHDRPVWRE